MVDVVVTIAIVWHLFVAVTQANRIRRPTQLCGKCCPALARNHFPKCMYHYENMSA